MRHSNPPNKQNNLAEVLPFKRTPKPSRIRPGAKLLKQLTALADSIDKIHEDISVDISDFKSHNKRDTES